MKYFADMFKRTFDFYGKSTLREYWFSVLFYLLFAFCVGLIALAFVADINIFLRVSGALSSLYELILFLPMLSITIRRLHDAGKSGYYVLLSILPIIGTIILIYILCQPSVTPKKVQVWNMPNDE